MNQDKSKALQAALEQIEKQFGKGSIMRMNDKQIWQLVLVDYLVGELLKFLDQNHQGKLHCVCT
jgi:hypothetical protein